MVIERAIVVAIGGLLALAVAADVAWRRVPNAVVLPIAVGGLAAQLATGGPIAAGWSALVALGILAVLMVPWASGKLGGGDVKLIAATAIWLGPSRVAAFLVFTAIAGAPVALATRLHHLIQLRREAPGATPHGCRPVPLAVRETVPLAAAIVLGAFAALSWRFP